MKKVIVFFLPISFLLSAMDNKKELGEIYTVPANRENPYSIISQKELKKIKPSSTLTSLGVITSLVFRPETNKRITASELKILFKGIEGDKQTKNNDSKEYDAVTLMRSDVAEVLGGSFVTGDNIHVANLDLGTDKLSDGDLVIIKNNAKQIKAILLKTHQPHYGCWELEARCGKDAFELINAFGQYEEGFNVENGILQPVKDRLRGIRLAVLKEGNIALNDEISFVGQNNLKSLLNEYNLQDRYSQLMQATLETAKKEELKYQTIKELRKKKN